MDRELVDQTCDGASPSFVKQTYLEDLQFAMWGGRWKLVNAAAQRWSSMTKVLRRVLEQWWALRQLSLVQMGDASFALAPYKQDLEEFLALMEPVQAIIALVQAHQYPTAALAVLRLGQLRSGVLNPKQKMSVIDYSGPNPQVQAPAQGPDQQSDQPAGGAPRQREPVKRMVLHRWTAPQGITVDPRNAPAHLTSRARLVREKLKTALDNRFFIPRYGRPHWSSTREGEPPRDKWLLDMCVLVTPQARMLDLAYIDPIVAAMGGSGGELLGTTSTTCSTASSKVLECSGVVV